MNSKHDPDAFAYLPVAEISTRLRSGEIRAEDLVTTALARIDAVQAQLHPYVTIERERALARAETLDAHIRAGGGHDLLLLGTLIGLKDICALAGTPTRFGGMLAAPFPGELSATIVQRLEAAGAIIIGKTQLTEGAFSLHHPEITAPINPWHPEYWTGVSSSGSGVAAAAGLATVTIGSDTGGSIRFPSACNGLVGLKPTWGRVSMHGVFPLAPSLDHIGPMGRCVADVAATYTILAGQDGADPFTDAAPLPKAVSLGEDLSGLTIGVDASMWHGRGLDGPTRAAGALALERFTAAGAELREITLPSPDVLMAAWQVQVAGETYAAHADLVNKHGERYGPVFRAVLDAGRTLPVHQLMPIHKARYAYRAKLRAVLNTVDLIVCPVLAFATPRLDEVNAIAGEDPLAFLRYTAPINFSGHPSLTLPAGAGPDGVPIGIQLIGPHWAEAQLLAAGAAYEHASGHQGWPRPPIH